MYTYRYVKSKAQGFFTKADHREIIDEYSKDGWRFITAIPLLSNNAIIEFDKIKLYSHPTE